MPLYPAAAWSAHLGGTINIEVTIEKGAVIKAQVKNASVETQGGSVSESITDELKAKLLPYLSAPSVSNVKTWKFQPAERSTFVVTYVYAIQGEETLLPDNPQINLDLPRLVRVVAKPFKPTCSDCAK